MINGTTTNMLTFKVNNIKAFGWGMAILFYTFMLVFTGRFEAYTPYVTKGLTPLLLIIAIIVFKNPVARFPKEYFVYIVLFLWAILSIVKVDNYSYYLRYLQLFLGIAMLLSIACIILTRYKVFHFFHVGFLIGAVLLLYDAYINYNFAEIVAQEVTGTRLEGQTGNANTIGAILLLASFSAIFIFDAFKNILIKIIAFVTLVALIIGIIATASRSSTLCITITISFYIIGKLYIKRKYLILLISAIILSLSITAGYNYIMEETFMGKRIENQLAGRDGSTNERTGLIFKGINLAKKNPVIGVGMGNFTNNAGGHYAHNDIIEITATLGIIGLMIYLLLFILLFVKIFKLQKRKLSDRQRSQLLLVQIFLFVFFINGLFKPLFIDLSFMFYLSILIAETHRLKLKYAHLSNHQYA